MATPISKDAKDNKERLNPVSVSIWTAAPTPLKPIQNHPMVKSLFIPICAHVCARALAANVQPKRNRVQFSWQQQRRRRRTMKRTSCDALAANEAQPNKEGANPAPTARRMDVRGSCEEEKAPAFFLLHPNFLFVRKVGAAQRRSRPPPFPLRFSFRRR